jgi:ribonuclease VapC
MILDTSAIAAILLNEAERDVFREKIEAAAIVGVGAPTLLETSIVLDRRARNPQLLEGFLGKTHLVIVPFGRDHWLAAAQAHLTYGEGRHPAGLNFGDCLTYAIAKVAGEPLLAKGDDFAKTDLVLV